MTSLRVFQFRCDTNGVQEKAVSWLWQFFIDQLSAAELHACKALVKDSQESKQDTVTYFEAINYPLETHTSEMMRLPRRMQHDAFHSAVENMTYKTGQSVRE